MKHDSKERPFVHEKNKGYKQENIEDEFKCDILPSKLNMKFYIQNDSADANVLTAIYLYSKIGV